MNKKNGTKYTTPTSFEASKFTRMFKSPPLNNILTAEME